MTDLLFVIPLVFTMLFVWLRVQSMHSKAMADCSPERKHLGCAHCAEPCQSKEEPL